MSKKICRYVLQMGRSSDIEGVFIMTDEGLQCVREMKGYEVHYGEISGKHSDVSAELDINDIEILSDKEEEVAFFERILPRGAGFNFKSYWFDTDNAAENGYEAAQSASYKDAQEAFVDYPRYNNSVMRAAFIESFDEARKDANENKE